MPLGGFCRNVVTGIVLAALASGASAEGLKDVLASAYSNSPALKQAQATLRSTDEGVVQANAAFLPQVSLSGSASRNVTGNQNSATVQLRGSMALYNQSDVVAIDVAEEAVVGARHQLTSTEQDVLLGAIQAYMQLRQVEEIVRLRENNVKVIEQELQAARDRFDVGEITLTDVAQAEAQLAQSQSLLAQAKGDEVRAQEAFRNAVGRAPKGLSAPGALPGLPSTVQAAKAIANASHPDILAAQSQVAQAELRVARAELATDVTVDLSGSVGMTSLLNGNTNDSANFSITATKPVLQGVVVDAAVRQASAQRDAARSALLFTQMAVEQQVGAAYARLNVARANVQAIEAQVSAAQIAFDGVREETILGARTTLDVLAAEQNLLDARANLVAANTELVVASYSVLASIGRLTAAGLKLNVDLYDPEVNYTAVTATSERGSVLDQVLGKIGN
jgi:outer membrane protein